MAFDWFQDVKSTSSVHFALDSLVESLDMRRSFTHVLRQHLAPDNIDKLGLISSRISTLKKNIDARLSSLNTKKSQHLFEKSHLHLKSTFHQSIDDKPILNALRSPPHQLMTQIERSWRTRQPPCFTKDGCLWFELLELNVLLDKMAKLPPPWGSLSLKDPKSLHHNLSSISLDRFLKSISQELNQAQTILETCYWALHRKTKDFVKHSDHRLWPIEAPKKQTQDTDLELFKFSDMPSVDELKRRYYQLARVYHPDIPGGSPEDFQKLQTAYQRLSKKCSDQSYARTI